MATNKELSEYIREGRQWRDSMTTDMATLKANAIEFNKYVKNCDTDRDDLGKRLNTVEKTQAVNSGVIAAGLTAITLVGGFLEFLRK